MSEPLAYLNGRLLPATQVALPLHDAGLVLGNMFVSQQVEAATGVGFIALGAAVYGLFLRVTSQPDGSLNRS